MEQSQLKCSLWNQGECDQKVYYWTCISCSQALMTLFCALLVFFIQNLYVEAWFKSNGSLRNLQELANAAPKIPTEHNPEPGVLAMRKRRKGDFEALRSRNAIMIAQAKTPEHRQALKSHWYNSTPVIGRMTPHAGPVSGGTRVHIYGYNLDGGSKYVCKFGHELVTGFWDKVSKSVVCVSPSIKASMDTSYTSSVNTRNLYTIDDYWSPWHGQHSTNDVTFFNVQFSIAVFFDDENKTHHAASHDRKFHYYVPKLSVPSIFAISPTLGPMSGGTIVTIHASHIAGWEQYVCHFGDVKSVAIHQQAISGATEYLLCTAPSMSGDPNIVNLTIHIAGSSGEVANTPMGAFEFEYYSIGIGAEDVVVSEIGSTHHLKSIVVPQVISAYKTTAISMKVNNTILGRQNAVINDNDNNHGQLLIDGFCRFGGVFLSHAIFHVPTKTFVCKAPPELDLPLISSHNSIIEEYVGHDDQHQYDENSLNQILSKSSSLSLEQPEFNEALTAASFISVESGNVPPHLNVPPATTLRSSIKMAPSKVLSVPSILEDSFEIPMAFNSMNISNNTLHDNHFLSDVVQILENLYLRTRHQMSISRHDARMSNLNNSEDELGRISQQILKLILNVSTWGDPKSVSARLVQRGDRLREKSRSFRQLKKLSPASHLVFSNQSTNALYLSSHIRTRQRPLLILKQIGNICTALLEIKDYFEQYRKHVSGLLFCRIYFCSCFTSPVK